MEETESPVCVCRSTLESVSLTVYFRVPLVPMGGGDSGSFNPGLERVRRRCQWGTLERVYYIITGFRNASRFQKLGFLRNTQFISHKGNQ